MSAVDESVTGVTAPRRVRHEVRDGLAVMAFSVAASVVFGLLLALLAGHGK